MNYGFWNNLKRPIIGLSPMDGVTDAAFRYISDKYGKPAVLFTEFTSVEGITRGAVKILDAFIYHKTSTPTVAQVYGSTPQSFYDATFVVCEMGFDGIDINMGCPDHNISKRGSGAALIRTPQIARKIIKAVKKATKDYFEGKKIEDTDLPEEIIFSVKKFKDSRHAELVSASKNGSRNPLRSEASIFGMTNNLNDNKRKHLPVSIKTRIGYDLVVTENWIKDILETEPVAISIHGRTLQQMYTGKADWEEIGKAAEIVKKTKTLIFGNGDVKSIEEAKTKAQKYGLDGVLIGRATFGNPWIFQNHIPTNRERIDVALEHCEVFTKLIPNGHFPSLRKHLAWYTKGIPGSNELRNKLMRVYNIQEVGKILLQQVRS